MPIVLLFLTIAYGFGFLIGLTKSIGVPLGKALPMHLAQGTKGPQILLGLTALFSSDPEILEKLEKLGLKKTIKIFRIACLIQIALFIFTVLAISQKLG